MILDTFDLSNCELKQCCQAIIKMPAKRAMLLRLKQGNVAKFPVPRIRFLNNVPQNRHLSSPIFLFSNAAMDISCLMAILNNLERSIGIYIIFK